MKSVKTLLLMAVPLGFSLTMLAQVVTIPVPGLEAAILYALNRPGGDITVQDMGSLYFLDAANRAIESIEGLGSATNLIGLSLAANKLTDVVIPPGMSKLTSL